MSKFESYDLYAENRDFLKSAQIITFNDLNGNLMALKPDITLSIIKNFTGNSEKVYYNETVYRPKDGHFKEIQQAGVECIGDIDVYSEAEMLTLAAKSLSVISGGYILCVSDSVLLGAILDELKLRPQIREKIISLLAAKNIPGLDAVCKEESLTPSAERKLKEIFKIYTPLEKGLETIAGAFRSAGVKNALNHLRDVSALLKSIKNKVYLDFSTVNSLDYYNGIIFQGSLSDIPFTVLSGGRYDKIPQSMGKDCEAIGFAMYIDEIENYTKKSKKHSFDILMLYNEESDIGKMTALAEAQRALGKSVLVAREGQEDLPKCRKTVNAPQKNKGVKKK